MVRSQVYSNSIGLCWRDLNKEDIGYGLHFANRLLNIKCSKLLQGRNGRAVSMTNRGEKKKNQHLFRRLGQSGQGSRQLKSERFIGLQLQSKYNMSNEP